MTLSRFLILSVPMLLGACASVPPGPIEPAVMVVPGPKKSIQSFRADEARCRYEAEGRVGSQTPGEAAGDSMVRSAAVGTALGAGAGAVIGSTQGHVGSGAAIGAASGLLLGSALGSDAADRSAGRVQRRYDIAYAQCMTAAGNQVQAPPPRPREVVVYEEPVVYRPAPVVVYGGPVYYHRW